MDADPGPARRRRPAADHLSSTRAAPRSPRHATVHLAPRIGTNVAVLNALLHELIANGWVDHDYVDAHTVGYDELAEQVADCTVEWAASICDVPGRGPAPCGSNHRALAGRCCAPCCRASTSRIRPPPPPSRSTTSSCCAACSAGPGAGVLQMNGQPTAQNTRECGANGDLPGFRNWENAEHIAELAEHLERRRRPDPALRPADATPCRSSATPSRARSSSCGSAAPTPRSRCPSCPASAPSSARTGCSVIVQDLFLTETAAAGRRRAAGRDVGREDRRVHQRRPHRPPVRQGGRPARARPAPDLDIFLDYATRMDFRDKDGQPLVSWTRSRDGVRGLEACIGRSAVRLHRPDLRQAARRQRHPVAVHRGRTRTAPNGSTPTDASSPTPTRPRPTARTSSPAPRSTSRRVPRPQPRRQSHAQGGRIPAAARDARRATTRSSSPPAARSTTSTPAPRPVAPPS